MYKSKLNLLDTEIAIKYIKDALVINDTSSSIYYIPLLLSQAHAYEILEQHQGVVETFYRILQSKDIKENYYYIGTLQNAARYYNRVGNVEEAFKHIKKAIKAIDKSNFDKYAELLSDLARFYYDSNKKDKGINLQEEVIEIRKSNLKDDDEVVSVTDSGYSNVFISTFNGYGLWYDVDEISVVGIKASGVKSINLKKLLICKG